MPTRHSARPRASLLVVFLAALLATAIVLPTAAQAPATPDVAAQPESQPPQTPDLTPPAEEGVEAVVPAEVVVEETEAPPEPDGVVATVNDMLDKSLGKVVSWAEATLFFDLAFGAFEDRGVKVPFLVVFLALGAIFYTFWHGFINVTGFRHAWQIVFGKFSDSSDEGEIPPFRALTSALSATVGLGNIAGVAVAMVTGGPGALFWMMFLGLFGMCAKFHESTLAQMFRIKNPDGSISGGPMYFLDHGLKQISPGLAWLGKTLAVIFAIFCMLAALGGGNMFQANQAFEGFFSTFIQPGLEADQVDGVKALAGTGFGLLMAAVVAVVVIGGITRIGAATSKIVPLMAGIYIAACLTIILANVTRVPGLIVEIFSAAFSMDAAFGGMIGAIIVGFQRAAFSSEAGLGSSAIAHSAAKTDHPVREGFVASLEPFIDTIVICFLTGMTVLITGAYKDAEGGSSVTLYAFQQVGVLASWFPYILAICIVLFAFSTMISWCYYGERAWGYLFGIKTVLIFRIIFVIFVFIGSVVGLKAVLSFSDIMLLSMAFPNILGGVILAPMVKRKVQEYWRMHHSGELDKPVDTTGADI